MTARTLEEAELYRLAIKQALARLHTSIPGMVDAVHSDAARQYQWVDVLPMVRVPVPDADGAIVDEALPLLRMVPVGHVQGGGFFVSVPLAVGDHVLVQCSERSLDQWVQKATKGRADPVSPGHVEAHGLNGAIALPVGPPTLADRLEDVSGSDMLIGRDGTAGGAQALIRIRPDGSIEMDAPAGLTVNGNVDVFGNVSIDGDAAASGDVTADGEVTAGALVPATQVSATTHQHIAPTGPTSSPIPGT